MTIAATIRYYQQVSPDDWEPISKTKVFDSSESLDTIMMRGKTYVEFPSIDMFAFTEAD